ncbi:MAG TPA: hypothetical protein VFL04_07230 [Rectinemataceae bacterium]|nr:hypothetical protein [Rectinemataceae bacterium]
MSITEYLSAEPFSEIIRYHQAESPQDAVAFTGTIRKHPYDEDKCLLIGDAADREPAIFEFRIADVLSAVEMPAPVNELGTPRPLIKLWVRRGSFGIRYEPFEVDEPLRFAAEPGHIRERFMGGAR